jgi:hypothetical protein
MPGDIKGRQVMSSIVNDLKKKRKFHCSRLTSGSETGIESHVVTTDIVNDIRSNLPNSTASSVTQEMQTVDILSVKQTNNRVSNET